MRLDVILSPCLLSQLLCLVSCDDDKDDKKVKKLQIGVKKRVDPEDCKLKSRKGDILHMHYTVCTGFYYRNDPKFWDRYTWANSADPEEQSDQGLHCLTFCLHRLDSLLCSRAT